MDTMPRLRQQNKGTDTGRYRAKELPAILPQMPQADIDKCKATEYHKSNGNRQNQQIREKEQILTDGA